MWAQVDWIGNSEIPEIPNAVSNHKLAINKYKPPEDSLQKITDEVQHFYRKRISNTTESSISSERVTINISGRIFETYASTLEKFPETLLGNRLKRSRYFDKDRGLYFFDRHRDSFESILFYYQSNGYIQRPITVSLAVFIEEVKFFQLGETAMHRILHDEGLKSVYGIPLPEDETRRKIWLFVEYPMSSRWAKFFSLFSVFMILLSVGSFCMETLPQFLTYKVDMSGPIPVFMLENIFFKEEFFYLETICMVWFTIEIFIRFYSCPNRYEFYKSFLNILDIVAILPFYCLVFILCFGIPMTPSSFYVRFFRFLRLLRVIRVLKLSRHSKGLQVLAKTMIASARELTLLLFFLIVCVVIFATTVYYSELDTNPNSFGSIPASFWWAVVTMTTVGYGDMYPQTFLGKFIGSLCAVAGVLTIALPVPVIVSNFNYFYMKERETEELIAFTILKQRQSLQSNISGPDASRASRTLSKYDAEFVPVIEEKGVYGEDLRKWSSHSQENHHHENPPEKAA